MSNALVSIAPSRSGGKNLHGGRGARADFVAHLIATSAQDPQTRTRRRAEPEQAATIYRALGRSPAVTGRTLSRSL